ncbi:Uncharacterised protein [Enterobacter cloacae]|nr:Uncharacterised protein [Enterobacter cloacae]
MARFAFQQNELNLTIFVHIPVWVRRPVFRNQIALDNPGLFGVSTHVIRFIVAVQRFTGRLFVEEDNRHVLAACFLDHRTCRSRVNQVNSQRFHAFCQKNVNLIVLFRLVILGVIHQQLHVWR